MTTVTAKALYKNCGESHGKALLEKSLKTTPIDRHRGCGHGMLGQTVPIGPTDSSNREGPIADTQGD